MKQTTNGHDAISYLEGHQEGKIEGRKEVVDLLKRCRSETTREFIGFVLSKESWQSQLKKWGLDEENEITAKV